MNCLDKLELLSPPFRQRIHTQLKNTDASVAGGIGTGITGITDGVLTQAPKFGGAPTAWLCLLQTSIGKKSHAELSGYSRTVLLVVSPFSSPPTESLRCAAFLSFSLLSAVPSVKKSERR